MSEQHDERDGEPCPIHGENCLFSGHPVAEVARGGEPLPHSDRQLLQDLWVLFTSTPEEIARRFGESACTDDHTRINYALELMSGQIYESRSPDGDGPNNAGATAVAVPCPEARVTSVTAGRDLWPLLGSNTAGSEPADSLSPSAAGGGDPLALQVRALVAVLKEAVDVIRIWHGGGFKPETERELWRIYQDSPEMRKINAAIVKADTLLSKAGVK